MVVKILLDLSWNIVSRLNFILLCMPIFSQLQKIRNVYRPRPIKFKVKFYISLILFGIVYFFIFSSPLFKGLYASCFNYLYTVDFFHFFVQFKTLCLDHETITSEHKGDHLAASLASYQSAMDTMRIGAEARGVTTPFDYLNVDHVERKPRLKAKRRRYFQVPYFYYRYKYEIRMLVRVFYTGLTHNTTYSLNNSGQDHIFSNFLKASYTYDEPYVYELFGTKGTKVTWADITYDRFYELPKTIFIRSLFYFHELVGYCVAFLISFPYMVKPAYYSIDLTLIRNFCWEAVSSMDKLVATATLIQDLFFLWVLGLFSKIYVPGHWLGLYEYILSGAWFNEARFARLYGYRDPFPPLPKANFAHIWRSVYIGTYEISHVVRGIFSFFYEWVYNFFHFFEKIFLYISQLKGFHLFIGFSFFLILFPFYFVSTLLSTIFFFLSHTTLFYLTYILYGFNFVGVFFSFFIKGGMIFPFLISKFDILVPILVISILCYLLYLVRGVLVDIIYLIAHGTIFYLTRYHADYTLATAKQKIKKAWEDSNALQAYNAFKMETQREARRWNPARRTYSPFYILCLTFALVVLCYLTINATAVFFYLEESFLYYCCHLYGETVPHTGIQSPYTYIELSRAGSAAHSLRSFEDRLAPYALRSTYPIGRHRMIPKYYPVGSLSLAPYFRDRVFMKEDFFAEGVIPTFTWRRHPEWDDIRRLRLPIIDEDKILRRGLQKGTQDSYTNHLVIGMEGRMLSSSLPYNHDNPRAAFSHVQQFYYPMRYLLRLDGVPRSAFCLHYPFPTYSYSRIDFTYLSEWHPNLESIWLLPNYSTPVKRVTIWPIAANYLAPWMPILDDDIKQKYVNREYMDPEVAPSELVGCVNSFIPLSSNYYHWNIYMRDLRRLIIEPAILISWFCFILHLITRHTSKVFGANYTGKMLLIMMGVSCAFWIDYNLPGTTLVLSSLTEIFQKHMPFIGVLLKSEDYYASWSPFKLG